MNLAARLEQLNKEYGTRVLVSGTTVEHLAGAHGLAPVGEVVVRGKTVPVQIYRLDDQELAHLDALLPVAAENTIHTVVDR